MPKIYIIGASGAGKSYFAKRLSQKLGIAHLNLDDVAWIPSPHQKNTMIKRDSAEKAAYIRAFLSKHSDWIIEGVQSKDWLAPALDKAEQVLVLQVPVLIRDWRILKRSVRRKLGIEKSNHKENFLGVCRLIKYNHQYDKDILPQILQNLEQHGKRIHRVCGKRRFLSFGKFGL